MTNFARFTIAAATLSLTCLLGLHFASPEFEPNWRMASEYALGSYKWLLSSFFILWGLASLLLAALLWNFVGSKVAKAGVILLFISGIGEILAALFDVRQVAGHGLAGALGIPTLPIAALMISYHLLKRKGWNEYKRPILLSAHSTWISLLLMIVAMVVMMSGFEKAGIAVGPEAEPPKSVPDGVIALTGYANRLLIVAYICWLILISRIYLKVQGSEEALLHARTAARSR